MASKKTSTKQPKSQRKSTPKRIKAGGTLFTEYSPTKELVKNRAGVRQALMDAFMEGDKDTFQEVLAGYVHAYNITKAAKLMKVSRTVIYEAIDKNKNPGLASLCKIMKAFSAVETQSKAA